MDEARDSACLLLARVAALWTRYEVALNEHDISRPY
ncbi:DUF6959 family protein [Streptomyces nigra]